MEMKEGRLLGRTPLSSLLLVRGVASLLVLSRLCGVRMFYQYVVCDEMIRNSPSSLRLLARPGSGLFPLNVHACVLRRSCAHFTLLYFQSSTKERSPPVTPHLLSIVVGTIITII